MQRSVIAQQQLQAAIQKDIADRTAIHQARLRTLRTAELTLRALRPAGAPPHPQPLIMFANGDSWFDYPLSGNGIPFGNTDVLAQLGRMGTINPIVLSVAHHGDATTDELALPKQLRMIKALGERDNWGESGKPDAILFSGGGNDIAGEQFCIFLDYAINNAGLDQHRFSAVLGMVEASYRDLFLFRDRYAPGVPIYAHCYDFPIPNGVHPLCAGPWLQPSFEYMGWTKIADRIRIVTDALKQFRTLLAGLASIPTNNLTLVDTQGTLQSADWANELHPYPEGFVKIATLFVAALRSDFPNRI